MKSIISRIASSFKTKRVPIAACDCSDFVNAIPTAPSVDHIRNVVGARQQRTGQGNSSIEDTQKREEAMRGIMFDLKYRCGGAGRCTCEGAPACRFPSCFTMRPTIKGAEVQAARKAFEMEEAPSAAARALVVLAQQEMLSEAIDGIKQLVSTELMVAAGGRTLDAALVQSGDMTREHTPNAKTGADSAQSGVNPLHEDEALCEEVIALYLWRAALLVNTGCDEAAVCSLLNIAAALPQDHHPRVYAMATAWATLNDMEIIYYRGLTKQYASFPYAEGKARDRPLLLARVFESIQHDSRLVEYCAHVVFSKEASAIISRAQAAQIYGDPTEDPMKSLCVPMSMHYYRFKVLDSFWGHFFTLLCMPPLPITDISDATRQNASGSGPVEDVILTPPHILDAVGRSMLLHHLVLFAESREKDIESGAVADKVARLKRDDKAPSTSDYEHVLDSREMSIAMSRMKQLLVVAQSTVQGGEDEDERHLSGDTPISPQLNRSFRK